MDEFSTKVKGALEQATKKFLFDKFTCEDDFKKVEKTVEEALANAFGHSVRVRWVDHLLKISRKTFSSTFIVMDDRGEVRKFTISPEHAQMEFNDVVDENGKVVLVEKNPSDI
jgi:hypothetical protein